MAKPSIPPQARPKRLPLHRRPAFFRSAPKILEIGGGAAPYQGVTHAVDKFPDENVHRTGDMVLGEGVQFRQGELEAIPFTERFDFVYASHVFEHVQSPTVAAREISRVTDRGYIETPSPFREQLWEWPATRQDLPTPLVPQNEIHTLFVWTGDEPDTLHYIRKTPARLGEFCSCRRGQAARKFCEWHLAQKEGQTFDLEPLLPRGMKTTRLYFEHGVKVLEHKDFESACRQGACAYRSLSELKLWLSVPMVWFFPRFQKLRELCAQSGLKWRQY